MVFQLESNQTTQIIFFCSFLRSDPGTPLTKVWKESTDVEKQIPKFCFVKNTICKLICVSVPLMETNRKAQNMTKQQDRHLDRCTIQKVQRIQGFHNNNHTNAFDVTIYFITSLNKVTGPRSSIQAAPICTRMHQ